MAAVTQRLDKWLVYARFVKHRSIACDWIETGKVRLNHARASKSSQVVRPGDVLTFVQGSTPRAVRVLATAERRGPPADARLLFEDLGLAADALASGKKADANSTPLC